MPTRELAEQVTKAVESFATFATKDIRVVNLTQKVSDAVQRSLLADSPDIVIATPARASANLESSALSPDKLAFPLHLNDSQTRSSIHQSIDRRCKVGMAD